MKPNFEVENGVPYVDNAVTTPIQEQVLESMLPFLQESFADPEELYEPGRQVSESLSEFREELAEMVGASPQNVWFTSGGTESNNWVLRRIKRPGLAMSTEVEHMSVLVNTTTHIPVDGDGMLDIKTLRECLSLGDVSILSVQHANQETGVIQNISEISEICGEYGIPLHVDAAISFGVVPVDMFDMGANFLTISSHKAWGPVGAGALISDGRYELEPFIKGGTQESGMRAGPVNMPAVAGFVTAAGILRTSSDRWKDVEKKRNSMESRIKDATCGVVVGEGSNRLPNMSCLMFPGSDSAFLAAELERLYGMCIGIGGAAEEGTASRILEAMGMDRPGREAAIRLRFSPWLTKEEADQVLVGVSSALRAERERQIC